MPNYYEILEIDKTASEEEIKKAYRKGALKWHPDKHPDATKAEAEQKFKAISEAHNVLSDPEKKRIYDLQGEDGLKQHEAGANNPGMNPFGTNPNNFFNMFFGGQNPFGFPGGNTRQPMIKKVEPKSVIIPVTLKDLYFGSKKKVTIPLRQLCVGCQGMGGKNAVTCASCNGMGMVVISKMVGPNMIQQTQTICSACNGRKKRVETACTTCNTVGTVNNDVEFIVKIEPGMDNNDKMLFQNQGNENYEEERGDVIFILSLNDPDKRFTKMKHHLVYTHNIKIGDAIAGTRVVIEHFNGENIVYDEVGIIPDKSYRILKGKGMPRGDLYVYYNINYDDNLILNPNQKELIRRILPTTELSTTHQNLPLSSPQPQPNLEKLKSNFTFDKVNL